ncbi:MAG: dihydrolipoamide acetyltransferase family protein [Isosphaeraceae bacterium]
MLAAAEATAESRTPGGAFRPHSPMRRRIAQRLLESHQSTAPVTLTTTADATNLVNLRSQFRLASAASGQPLPSYNDLILKLTALVLRQHPTFNACWTDDGLRLLDEIDIALAVDTDAGLVSPVLRRVDQLGVRALAVESAALIGRARAGRLAPADLQDASFTVTSLGSLGIDAFTPIINPPQVAILGVGRIERKPVYTGDDRLVPRELMTLSLTFDHRAVDGGPAARFLRAIAEAIAAPAERLIV